MDEKVLVRIHHYMETTIEALDKHEKEPHMPLAGTHRYEYEMILSPYERAEALRDSDEITGKETNSDASEQRTAERDDQAGQDNGETDELVSEDANGRESNDADQQAGRDEQDHEPQQPTQVAPETTETAQHRQIIEPTRLLS